MTKADYKKGVDHTLTSTGFTKVGKLYCYTGAGVRVLLSVQMLEHGKQFFVNVGFWLTRFGPVHPSRVELTHLYFRLERIFPEYRETILCAGKLDDEMQPQAFGKFLELLGTKMASRLAELADEPKLRHAFKEGWLERGLIRKEAREVFS